MMSHHGSSTVAGGPAGTCRLIAEGYPINQICSKSGLMFPLPSLFNSGERYGHSWCLIAMVLLLLVLQEKLR